ncbi:MAG TPA: superoxide dismutase family protein [Gemmatimonadaceae bacterium]|nr:superoxide dismutase family protein [Gemmatimonadaceae bacterium]
MILPTRLARLAATAALALAACSPAQTPAVDTTAATTPPAGGTDTLGAAAGGARGTEAHATLRTADGRPAGTVTLVDLGGTGVLVRASFTNLPAGPHALHFHDVGLCEPPFTTAGGHFNPSGRQHGFLNPQGEHAGDLPNFTAAADGTANLETLAPSVSLGSGAGSLLGGDGTAMMVHATGDDYRSDPAGNAGDRIACGVVERR